MKKGIKIVLINVLIFAGLIVSLEFVFGILIDTRHYYGTKNKHVAKIEKLPVFDKYDWADTYFKEHNAINHEYRSYYGWKKLAFKGETINLNKDGNRITPQDKNSDENSPIIAFIGGSTVWGYGVNDENTIPAWFAKLSQKKYSLKNYGEFGYSAYQSYVYLQDRILHGETPNYVISYDGVNNTPAEITRYFSHAGEDRMIQTLKGSDTDKNYKPYTFRGTIEFASSLKRYAKRYFGEGDKPQIKVFNEKQNRRAAIELLETWLLTKKLSESVGAKFICVLQPVAYWGNPDTKHIQEHMENEPFKNGYEYYKYVFELLETEKYSGLKNHFVDATKALDGQPEVYMDYSHLLPEGNEIIARTLVKEVSKLDASSSE